MGFYIQDAYWQAAADMSAKEQDRFFGALVRRYFTQEDESTKGMTKLVKSSYNIALDRIDAARRAADKKDKQRDKTGDKPRDKRRDKTGDAPKKERESEREKNFQVETSSSETPPSLVKGGESRDGSLYPEDERPVGCVPTIGLSPEETARLIAEARRALA